MFIYKCSRRISHASIRWKTIGHPRWTGRYGDFFRRKRSTCRSSKSELPRTRIRGSLWRRRAPSREMLSLKSLTLGPGSCAGRLRWTRTSDGRLEVASSWRERARECVECQMMASQQLGIQTERARLVGSPENGAFRGWSCMFGGLTTKSKNWRRPSRILREHCFFSTAFACSFHNLCCRTPEPLMLHSLQHF